MAKKIDFWSLISKETATKVGKANRKPNGRNKQSAKKMLVQSKDIRSKKQANTKANKKNKMDTYDMEDEEWEL